MILRGPRMGCQIVGFGKTNGGLLAQPTVRIIFLKKKQSDGLLHVFGLFASSFDHEKKYDANNQKIDD
jgi:hypothetical protein